MLKAPCTDPHSRSVNWLTTVLSKLRARRPSIFAVFASSSIHLSATAPVSRRALPIAQEVDRVFDAGHAAAWSAIFLGRYGGFGVNPDAAGGTVMNLTETFDQLGLHEHIQLDRVVAKTAAERRPVCFARSEVRRGASALPSPQRVQGLCVTQIDLLYHGDDGRRVECPGIVAQVRNQIEMLGRRVFD
jgi:hypothetical protein